MSDGSVVPILFCCCLLSFIIIGILAISIAIYKWQPFSKSKKVNKASQRDVDSLMRAVEKGPTIDRVQLVQWANEELKKGVPRQIICTQLLNIDTSEMHPDDMQSYMEVERELSGVMVQRNLDGKALEKEGRIDEAISLYEANIQDKFVGSHPYERLRIIYTKRQDYPNAIRVCQAFIDLDTLELLNEANRKHMAHFEEWVEKLGQKRN